MNEQTLGNMTAVHVVPVSNGAMVCFGYGMGSFQDDLKQNLVR